MHRQMASGYVQAYEDSFLVWATKYLGVEDQAPRDVRRKLLSEG
jgi:hypothetical protein